MEKILHVREQNKSATLIEAEDARDTLQEIQVKNKTLNTDLDNKKLIVNSELQGGSWSVFSTHDL
jgi:hypothetical protein